MRTVDVQRQYTGTAGRIENAQVGVLLTYATAVGHTLIDRELYLPVSWTGDPDRCAAASVPADTAFATKTEPAKKMIVRALDGSVTVSWVTGDEVYGTAGKLRAELDDRGVGHVLAVACDHQVSTAAGSCRVDAVVARLPKRAWQRLSAGAGAKDQRFYDWAWISITAATQAPAGTAVASGAPQPPHRGISFLPLFLTRPGAAGHAGAGGRAALDGRGVVSDREEADRSGRAPGPDVDVVVSVDHVGVLAHLFLAVTTTAERASPAPAGVIPLTLNEIRHLFVRLVVPLAVHPSDCPRWSWWRRRHQHRAQHAHYQ